MSDATTDAILDALRQSVLDFGIRRTTLSDVARRAGVSRMTVYRRYPDVDAVLRDLLTRDFGTLMDSVDRSAGGETTRERLVARAVASVTALREHSLMRKVLEAEPELLLPYVIGHMGGTQRHAAAFVLRDVKAGQADGSIRDGDPRVIAQAVMLVAQSWVYSAAIGDDVSEAQMLAELERVLDAVLRP